MNTYYVTAHDCSGNKIGLYVEAHDGDSAWEAAESLKNVAEVQSVQLIFGDEETL
jgi:nitrate reductase NapAB chaperone NapD